MRLVGGILLAFLACSSAQAYTRAVEGERLRGAGTVVKDPRASRGRALELRLGAAASTQVRTGMVGNVLVRARHSGCAFAPTLLVQVDGGIARPVRVPRTFSEVPLRGFVDAGAHLVRVSFASGRGKTCRARIDRLRFRATKRRPAGPPSPGSPTATVPAGAVGPRRSIPLGSSVVLQHLRDDAAYEQSVAREFVQLTPENELKMNRIQPDQGRFEFGDPDLLADYAVSHGKSLRGHTLIFGRETPAWVSRILFAPDAEAALRDHVRTVMTRYQGRIREWDVVNEALEEDGTFKPNAWFDKLGPRYVDIAFAEARATDPGAKLYYNEINAETNNHRRAGVLNLVRKLKAQGLIDGVGLQLHTSIRGYPTREEIEESMRLFADLGLEVQVTEMDVVARGDSTTGSLADRLNLQAAVFRGATDACQAVTACTRFNVWGVTDRYSWLGAEEMPLLLDTAYGRKPAFTAVRAGLAP